MEINVDGPLRIEVMEDGAYWKVLLDAPPGNVIDLAMLEALHVVLNRASDVPGLKTLCFEGEGKHFSFGASVPEHLPGKVEQMLPEFHRLFRELNRTDLVLLAAVRGQCLGGGLELASFCHRVFATPDAKFGQPEVVLGVFAPVASIILKERMGRPAAEDLCLTGRILPAEEAKLAGLVEEICEDPGEAALQYARQYFGKLSASSLRLAQQAVRHEFRERLAGELETLERMYLQRLMKTKDAQEGIQAFLQKRKPIWVNA